MEYVNCSQKDINSIEQVIKYLLDNGYICEDNTKNVIWVKTNDIVSSNEKYCPEIGKVDLSNCNTLNGRVITPDKNDGKFYILITEDSFNSDQYIHTIAHEMIHVDDIINDISINGIPYYYSKEDIIKKKYHEFMCWTEFHAKKIGTLVYCIFLYHYHNGPERPKDGVYEFEGVDFRAYDVIEALIKKPERKVSIRYDWFWECIDALVAYLGRLSAFYKAEDIENIDAKFPAQIVNEILGINNVNKLYKILYNMEIYDDFKENSEEISKIFLYMQMRVAECLI